MSATVYGSSDDLIEVAGDIREEFYLPDDDKPSHVAFSNGALVSIAYANDGTWVIRVLAGDVTVQPSNGPDSDIYSDRATVNGSVSWAVCGQLARAAQ